jgi:hypothetical protein
MLPVNEPDVVTPAIWLPVAIGPVEVLQQIPLAVTAAPQLLLMVPPLVAVVAIISLVEEVAMVM